MKRPGSGWVRVEMAGGNMLRKSFFLWLLIALVMTGCMGSDIAQSQVSLGVVDLGSWDPERTPKISLRGQWIFFPGRLLTFSELDLAMRSGSGSGAKFVQVSGSWNRAMEKADGCATYVLRLSNLNPLSKISLTLSMKDSLTAYSLYLIPLDQPGSEWEPMPLMQNGVVSCQKSRSIPQHLPQVQRIPRYARDNLIMVHVSNFHDATGGLIYPLIMGRERTIIQDWAIARSFDFLVLGILLTMGFYHLLLFLQRRLDLPSLNFGLFNLLLGLRLLLTEKYAHEWFPVPNEMVFEFLMKLDHATFYLAAPVFFSFLYHLFFPVKMRVLKRASWYVSALFLLSLFWPQRVYSEFLVYYQFFFVIMASIMIYGLFIAYRLKERGSLISLIGAVVLAGAALNDILHSQQIVITSYILPYGFILFILAQSSLVAHRFAHAFETSEYLSWNLRKEVETRTRELQEMNRQLEESDRQKTQFYQNISHELKTPLTLIHVPLSTILNGEYGQLNNEQKTILSIIYKNSRHLLRLINELLDISKIEAKAMQLHLNALYLDAILQDIVSSFSVVAERKDISLVYEKKTGSFLIWGDQDKIEKIFFNLISNALKFTPAGGRIHINLELLDDTLSVKVDDNGIGIPERDLPLIFNRYHQAHGSGNRGGTGLGLAIVHEFVKMHGGRIDVQSRLNKGSTFWVFLPRHREIQNETGDQEPLVVPETLYRSESVVQDSSKVGENPEFADQRVFRIFFVDDNEDMRLFVYQILKKEYNLVLCADSEVAFDRIKQQQPDLVITDFLMPGLDGIDLCRQLKTDPETSAIPVLILTAIAGDDPKLRHNEKWGPDFFLAKPFHPQKLRDTIRDLLANRGTGEADV